MSSVEPELSMQEAKGLLTHSNAWMLRNIYDWDCDDQTNFWEIINDTPRRIEDLPSKTRNQIRRCLKDCDIKRISQKELIEDNGYNVYSEAFKRYKNIASQPINRNSWETMIASMVGYEFWGVYEKETSLLIAWAMNSIKGESVNYNSLKAIPEMMNKHYPYFGLLFSMNKYYLEELGKKYVSDGFRSITEHSNIQPFLEKNFFFRKAYCRLNIRYVYWLRIGINLLFPFRKYIRIGAISNILKFEEINRAK